MQRGLGRWTEFDYVGMISQAQGFIVQQKPEAHYEIGLSKLKRGALQTIPANGYAFIDASEVRENVAGDPEFVDLTTDPSVATGAVVGNVLKEKAFVLDNQIPLWRVPGADLKPRSYVVSELARAHFEVYPAVEGTTSRWVRLTYSAAPKPVENRPGMFNAANAAGVRAPGASYAAALIDLDGTYEYAIMCFMLHLAYARVNIGDMSMSEMWRARLMDALQLTRTGLQFVDVGKAQINTPEQPP